MFIYALVNSGQSVSGNIDARKASPQAIAVPTITSGDLMLQGNFDTTSAAFVRIQKAQPNTGDLRFATGVGSLMLALVDAIPEVAYYRLETGVVQTNPATFTILARPR